MLIVRARRGRDTCISFRGLLLVTERFDEARQILLFLASCIRHGLIPNLLDGGRNPRYNCRDAAWWFLQSVQDYCTMSSEGVHFLQASVVRHFPVDDQQLHREMSESGQIGKITFTIEEAIQVRLQYIFFQWLMFYRKFSNATLTALTSENGMQATPSIRKCETQVFIRTVDHSYSRTL